MSNHKLRFDSYVGTANTEPLKKMARIWGGNYKLRKAESIALICQGLANPQKVKEVVASLADHERTALALAKQMGGVIGIETLALGLRASGVSVPTSKSEYDRLKDIVRPLVEKGLFLSNCIGFMNIKRGFLSIMPRRKPSIEELYKIKLMSRKKFEKGSNHSGKKKESEDLVLLSQKRRKRPSEKNSERFLVRDCHERHPNHYV